MIIYRQDHAVVSLLTSKFLSLLGMLRPPTICCWYIDAGFTLCDLGIWKGMLHPGHGGLSHLDFWHDITAWENNEDQSWRTSLKKKSLEYLQQHRNGISSNPNAHRKGLQKRWNHVDSMSCTCWKPQQSYPMRTRYEDAGIVLRDSNIWLRRLIHNYMYYITIHVEIDIDASRT